MADGGLWTQINGGWTPVQAAYVKRNGAWVRVTEAHVKTGGSWVRSFVYDVTPPNAPTLSVDLVNDHLRVGVRLPDVNHVSDLAEIRVLYGGTTAFPATPNSSGYVRRSDNTFPDEEWSSYYYNGYKIPLRKCHDDSSVTVYKQYPVNASSDTKVDPGTYYFSAWAMDLVGNWSLASNTKFVVPKDYTNAAIGFSGRFDPNTSGTWKNGDTFTPGDLTQSASTAQFGVWYHGHEFTNTIGKTGTPKIKSAKIYCYRDANDTGEANAQIYAFWHGDGAQGSTSPDRKGTANIGTLAKGQSKWLDLPDAHLSALESGSVYGFGLYNRDPTKAGANPEDYSLITGSLPDDQGNLTAANTQSGEVYVVWTEKP